MNLLNRKSILLFSSVAFLSSCDEDQIENQLTNCEFVTSVFINDDAPDPSLNADVANAIDNDNPPFLDEQEIQICGRNSEELQAKIDQQISDNEELTNLFNTQNPVIQPIPNPQPVPEPEPEPVPVLPLVSTGFTITFDEMVDYTFGMGNNASIFSNDESTISAEVTSADVPVGSSDVALKVELTPGLTSGNFYFAGTILDISNLGFPEIDFSGSNKSIIVNVYSTVAFGFRVQIQDAEGDGVDRSNVASPTPGFKDAAHTGSGWEQITIDFNEGVNTIFGVDGIVGGQPQMEPLDGIYNRVQLQFESLPVGVSSTIFIDNFNYSPNDNLVVVGPDIPVTSNNNIIEFDEMDNDYLISEENDSAFAFSNAESSIEVSLSSTLPTDGNRTGSGSAIQVDLTPVLTSGGFYFAGLGYDLPDYSFEEIDFTGPVKSITFNVWSNVAFGFRAQVSDTAGMGDNRESVADPAPGFKDGFHGGTGWEEITIDFSNGVTTVFGVTGVDGGQPQTQELDSEYSRLQVQFENLPLNTQSTIYFDNIRYNQ